MTLTQYLETLTVTNNAGDTVPLRYSYRQGVYMASGEAVVSEPPPDQPFVTIQRISGGNPLTTHNRNYVFDNTLIIQVHHRPGSGELSPDPAAAVKLWREILKMDSSTSGVTIGEEGGTLIPPLMLAFSPGVPQELYGSRELLGEVRWTERVQYFQLD